MRALTVFLSLVTEDAVLGFLEYNGKDIPEHAAPTFLVHKTANLVTSLHKSMQLKIKTELRELWLIESYDAANKAINVLLVKFLAKCYPAELKKLEKNEENGWDSIASCQSEVLGINKMTNPIQSTFVTFDPMDIPSKALCFKKNNSLNGIKLIFCHSQKS
ncbi:MAG: transposase [Arsenophonus sp. NC-PG7-MAG3]